MSRDYDTVLPTVNPSNISVTAPECNTTPISVNHVALAEFIASDAELAIYRRFDSSTARILLYLQREIQQNQDLLDELDRYDTGGKSAALPASYRGNTNNDSKTVESEKKALLLSMKILIKDYCK